MTPGNTPAPTTTGKQISALKPGVKTSEFWLTLLTLVSAIAALVLGMIDAPWAITAAGASAAIYTWCRRSIKLESLVIERHTPGIQPPGNHTSVIQPTGTASPSPSGLPPMSNN